MLQASRGGLHRGEDAGYGARATECIAACATAWHGCALWNNHQLAHLFYLFCWCAACDAATSRQPGPHAAPGGVPARCAAVTVPLRAACLHCSAGWVSFATAFRLTAHALQAHASPPCICNFVLHAQRGFPPCARIPPSSCSWQRWKWGVARRPRGPSPSRHSKFSTWSSRHCELLCLRLR